MKTEQYIPTENLSDYARSSASDWVMNLWNHSGRARIIVISKADFQLLNGHPEILDGRRGGWIKVHNTTLFFPLLGLTLVNKDMLEDYSTVTLFLNS